MEIENKTLVKNIQDSFLGLLNNYLPKDILDKARQGNTVKILSIACGRFREAKSIFDYFQKYENHVKLYGIDVDNDLLKLVKEEKVTIKCADAKNIESYKEWLSNGKFDLIIVRHPEITLNTDDFIKIFSTCVNVIALDGHLLITTHYEDEKNVVKNLLKLLKFNVLTDVKNEHSPSLKKDNESIFVDRFLLLASAY